MDIASIGVHDSVDGVFPSGVLRSALADTGVDATVEVVGGARPASVDALVTLQYHETFLDADLAWIHSIQSGVDRFPFADLQASEVRLTNSTGVHRDWVGETVAGYLLALARGLHRFARSGADAEWSRLPWDRFFTVADETVCVVGLGVLGRGIAERAAALDADVIGVKRSVEPVEHVDRVYGADALQAAISEARFVALAVPLTDETEGLIGPAEFRAMREDAFLCNVARGAVVAEGALVDAIREGEIAGAALDVFETEPLPEDSPLWEFPEVLVTPHSAGLSREYPDAVAEIVAENVRRFRAGEEPVNGVI